MPCGGGEVPHSAARENVAYTNTLGQVLPRNATRANVGAERAALKGLVVP
jgi:hypothetical protein